MLRYIIYCRKSLEAEDRQVPSIESQINELKSLARRSNFKMIDVLTESRSAKAAGRPGFADILSEARKYGLNLILAHQYIEQLDEKIRAAVFGNAGTVVCFRVGTRDTRYLAQEFYPVFSGEDLVNLPNHHIYLKLMIDGRTSIPFSAVTLPPPERHGSNKEEVVRLSREKYGRPQAEVEREVRSRPFPRPKASGQGCLI